MVNQRLNAEAQRLSEQEDKLVTSFVTENFDNVLGPGVFFMVTIGNPYPELTPWIEDIMSKATEKFKNDAYVKDYYQKAQENQAIMNGMRQPDNMQPTQATDMQPASATDMQHAPQSVPQGPTPNEMAKPAE